MHLGGPDGELGAATRYLSQRYGAPTPQVKALLTDIGTEELGHFEMICAIVYQLTRNLSVDDLRKGGFDAYYVDHTTGLYPASASGTPFSAATIQSTGDVLADLHEDLAADATFKIIKTKFVYGAKFDTLEELQTDFLDYVNWFNNIRIHGSLGYLSPVDYKNMTL